MLSSVEAERLRQGALLDVTIGSSPHRAERPISTTPLEIASSHCRLRIYRPTDQLHLVVLSDGPDNPGMSVTNAIEHLACIVLNQHVQPCDWPRVLFFQHYPPLWFTRYATQPQHRYGWSEELQHVSPAIICDRRAGTWLPTYYPATQQLPGGCSPHGTSTWRHLAHVRLGELHICHNCGMDTLKGPDGDNPAIRAIARWLMGEDVNLTPLDAYGLLVRWSLAGMDLNAAPATEEVS